MDKLSLEETLAYAKRVAFRMSRDPEAESLAGVAAWSAHREFDGTRNVPYKRWIAVCVRMAVYHHWRKRARRPEETRQDLFWEDVYSLDEIDLDSTWTEDFQLLTESFVDRWPLDVIARRHGMTVYAVRKRLAEAKEQFLHAQGY
jgi:DNA-directed RNA polymerase specialized sigma24 family protein